MGLDPRWEEIFSTRPWGRYPAEELIRFFAAHCYGAPVRHAVKVFEAGFGTGANLWYAAREGFTVFGLEGATAGWQRACARLDAEVPQWRAHGAQLRVGDACLPLPWPDASFDVALDSDALTCNSFGEAQAAYRELYRVTRPGGRLYVRTPAVGSWGEGTGTPGGRGQWQCDQGPFAGTGLVRFTREDELPELLGPWHIEQVEEVSRTLQNRRQLHREWVVCAVRPQQP